MELNRQNYEEAFVEYMEGTLTVAQQLEVEKFISANPDLKQELEAFQETVLVADETIVFEKKNLLYRNEVVAMRRDAPLKRTETVILQTDRRSAKTIPLFIKFGTFAAAAAVILFVTFTFLNRNEAVEINPTPHPVAQHNNNGTVVLPNVAKDVPQNSLQQNSSTQKINSVAVNNSATNNFSLKGGMSICYANNLEITKIVFQKTLLSVGKTSVHHLNYLVSENKNPEPVIAVVPRTPTKTSSSIFVVASVLATDLYSLSGRTMAFGKKVMSEKKLRMGDIAIDLGFVKFTHHPYARK